MRVAGTAVPVPSDSGFRVVVYGIDPQLLLPEITVAADRPITAALRFRLVPLAKALDEILQRAQSALIGNVRMSQAKPGTARWLEERRRSAEGALTKARAVIQDECEARRQSEAVLTLRLQGVQEMNKELERVLQEERSRCQLLECELATSRTELSQATEKLAKVTGRLNQVVEEHDGLQVELIVQRARTQSQASTVAERESPGKQIANQVDVGVAPPDYGGAAELKRALAATQARVRELEESISWTITAPLRSIASLLFRK
jgi:chromosome segregation ATPase